MKVTAIVSRTREGWLAQCEEADCAGEGATQEQALAQLRVALDEYFRHPEAVAPPPEAPHEAIEIIVVDG
jgi:hypothetical protein